MKKTNRGFLLYGPGAYNDNTRARSPNCFVRCTHTPTDLCVCVYRYSTQQEVVRFAERDL